MILFFTILNNIAVADEFLIGKDIYDRTFGRGCGACHDIPSNPQLRELIKTGELDIESFYYTLMNGKNGMPRAIDSIMSVESVIEAGYTEEQAINAIYKFLGGEDNIKIKPILSIKVNDSTSNYLELYDNEMLTIKVKISAGDELNNNVDWWVVAYNDKLGWLYFDLEYGWIETGNLANILPSYQGALFNFEYIDLFSTPSLNSGVYDLYFGVDLNINGILDEPLYYDHFTVKINQTDTYSKRSASSSFAIHDQ